MAILSEVSAAGGFILLMICIPAIILALVVLIWILIIRAICKYMARKNAEAFDYDYLAERIAEETCKRMMIIENSKAAAANSSQTNDQQDTNNADNASVQP